ncbi:MAG: MFS transporter [Gemmataceae bacterium]|nr:MFS transporter [Gemmataceae bacterium]
MSTANVVTAPNAYRLLWAGFFSIFAAGVGFSVRAGILGDWASAYGFTNTELGTITGGGLVGFGVVIILGSLIADRIGYGVLMSLAFLMHVISAVMVLFSDVIYQMHSDPAVGRNLVYWNLYFSMFIFSIANGLCEVVVNPMTATLFPTRKTHYLNILHAGWPGGLIAGGLIAFLMNEPRLGDWAPGWKVNWMIQMVLFLVPVLIYGALLVGQRLPRSEAGEAGVSLKTMLLEFGSPILLLLLLIHAMVGYVELGTDSWIARITGGIMEEGALGRLFFVYTSALMFTLRFFAGPLEQVLTPLGLLFTCAVVASIGLVMLGTISGWEMCLLAVTVYGFGKTFFWPTMLAVASERFPRGGAVVLGAIGGVGMLSAGLLGSPGIGVKQDYYASTELKKESEPTFLRYKAKEPNSFYGLFEVQGLDGAKVGVLELAEKLRKAETPEARAELSRQLDLDLQRNQLTEWWQGAQGYAADRKLESGTVKPGDATLVTGAQLHGGQMALLWTALVPAAMAVLFLLLIFYFVARGGYKPVVMEGGGTQLGTGES